MKNLKTQIFAFMFAFVSLIQPVQQAQAFVIPVFDANNFSQNLITAARTLEQINNQVHLVNCHRNSQTDIVDFGRKV